MESQEIAPAAEKSVSSVFIARLVFGLAQGLALYLLYSAYDDKVWPAMDGAIFAPMVMVSLYIPLLIVQAIGNVRAATLVVWTLLATALVASLGWYDIWHGWPTEPHWQDGKLLDVARLLPSFGVFFFSAGFLFIAHALISGGDADRRVVAHYRTHFDVAWKMGLQFVLAFFFVDIFWLLLWLGAHLFKMINLDFLERLIEHRWFYIPATTLAAAAAIHITDVRAVLIRGARALVLALLSWLLPLIALIAAGFLVGLAFTGLEPLWKTRIGTSMLLVAAAWLIVLINAAYQDGDAERKPMRVLRIAGTLGGVLLVPIVALAGYAVWLRVAQYGWTADRISAVACVLVAAAYALGYAVAALWPGSWFKPVERWNFVTSLLVLAVIGALFSPVADPMKISVASQMARLESGKVKPDKFDFYYLHREGGRFGKDALTALAKSKNAKIGAAAKDALTNTYPRYRITLPPPPPTPQELAKSITVRPKGAALPQSFLKTDWSTSNNELTVSDCLSMRWRTNRHCDAVLKDIDGDGVDEIVLISSDKNPKVTFWEMALFKEVGGKWRIVAVHSEGDMGCVKYRQMLLAGEFKAVAPVQPDLDVGGRRMTMLPRGVELDCK